MAIFSIYSLNIFMLFVYVNIDIERRVKAQVTNGICANHRIKINSLEQNEYNTVCSTKKLNNLFSKYICDKIKTTGFAIRVYSS
jgi:hypothetical protein